MTEVQVEISYRFEENVSLRVGVNSNVLTLKGRGRLGLSFKFQRALRTNKPKRSMKEHEIRRTFFLLRAQVKLQTTALLFLYGWFVPKQRVNRCVGCLSAIACSGGMKRRKHAGDSYISTWMSTSSIACCYQSF